ncbi:hypothetical protein PENARI_c012G11376 [Penicillium arizonense]|uniref:Transcription factor domain-containing protein n=1 Tax=Penicillium arizonense TaxID=1835702 RepID=A0A1F5LFZ1_PENAI|nr:hypothetical protein PENARI_c012G11376 [Penicillium arizonense]OGE51819.1 hypothetical protein PENARI_c012G11376 [Penicillium arizonense]
MPKETSRKEGSKRDKYTSQACFECQRRKVKGSPYVPAVEPEASSATTPGETNKKYRCRKSAPERNKDVADALFFNMSVSESDQSLKRRSPSMSNISDNDIFENRSVGSFRSYQDIPSPLKEPMESDTLGVATPSLNSLPIGSQLNALRQLRQPSATGDPSDPSQSGLATVTLQEPQVLWELVNVFFQEFESYFPCLNQAVIYERLSMVLSLHGYEYGNHRIVIGPEHCKIIAILLNMLAYAESLTHPVESCKPRPVSQSYVQGLKLMQYFNKLHECDLETVIYHTTSSAFLLEMSMHHMALQSITQGFQIALKIGLNNQTLWPNDDSDLVSRQGLWWTLYFLDKRITQKCGITYFLREDESAVSDFSKLKNHMGSSKHEILQSLISFSRLWAHIWDGFFSPQAPKVDDWEESQMMDTRIVLSYRQIPASLHWKSSMVAEYMCVEGDTHIRQRLIVFLRFQSLRLSIRHKPLTFTEHDIERRKTSVSICEAIIEAIRSYMTMATSLKPSGYILTTSLVEILYHILPEECDPKPIIPGELLKGMVCAASQLLQTLSNSVATASKVYQYLRDLLPPYDRFRPFDEFTASPPSQNEANQKAPFHCSADLDTLSETFWRTIVDRPGQEKSPAATHSEPSNPNFLPFSMAMSENFATDCLPFKMDDLQCQLLMGMDLEDMAFKAPHALSVDYSTTHFGGDLL